MFLHLQATESSGTELLSLRSKIRDLEQKLNVADGGKNKANVRRRFYSESFTGMTSYAL
jgi:uncharacterized protein YxjI